MLVMGKLRSKNTGKTSHMGRRLYISGKSCNFIAHIELLYSDGDIINSTFDNGDLTSRVRIKKKRTLAYYSKEGKEMNVLK